jgi:hypothetical protein
MDNPGWSAVWFGWAFVTALGTRIAFTRVFRKPLGVFAQPAAYATWVLLVAMGLFVIALTGFVFYGYDHSDAGQRVGYYLFWFSPFGVPTLVGAPAVLLFDLVLTIWKRFSSPRPSVS